MFNRNLCFFFLCTFFIQYTISKQHKVQQRNLQDDRELKKKNVWKSFEKQKAKINKKLRQQKQKIDKKTKIQNIKKKMKDIDTHKIMQKSKREEKRRQFDNKQKIQGKKPTKSLSIKSEQKSQNKQQRQLPLDNQTVQNAHDFHLKNFDFENPEIDYDFLNGKTNVQDYQRVQEEEYSLEQSIKYLQVLQLKLENCQEISKNNSDNAQFFNNPKLKFCQVDFVFEIHVLRNVYFKIQQKIYELIPEVVIVEERSYTKYEFFKYIMQLEVINYKDIIVPILKTQMQLDQMVMWDIKYYQLVQNIFKIRKIVKDFQQIEYFAQRFHKKGLVVFVEGLEKEMLFLTEVQTLVNVYSQSKRGQQFLQETKHQFEEELKKKSKKDRKLVMQQQSQIEKLLDNKDKSLDEIIAEEQEFLNQVDHFNEDAYMKFKSLPEIKYDAILAEILKQFPIQRNNKIVNDPFKKMQRKIQNTPIEEKAVIKIVVDKKDVEKYKNLIRKVLKIKPERKALSIDQQIKETENLHKKLKNLKEKNIARQLKQQDKYIRSLKKLKHYNMIQII